MLHSKLSNTKIIKTITRYSIFLFIFIWIILSFLPLQELQESEPPRLYTSECEDRLFQIFTQAIAKAKQEIHLVIYALSDQKVIEALNDASKRGISIKIIYDSKTDTQQIASLSKSIETMAPKHSALMHRKLLVIDRSQVYIGSANFTPPSLRLHHNLVLGMKSPPLAQCIIEGKTCRSFEMGGQYVEFYTFPEDRELGISRLLELIDNAQDSIVIGMFTWTYPPLTEAIIRAHKRGIKVIAVLDQQSAYGASNKTVGSLLQAGVSVRIGPGHKLFHHKFLCIDHHTLVTGSANWTKAAFYRNHDCLVILHRLTRAQQKKVLQMITTIRCTTFSTDKEHFEILR